jgi:hypothetical protein
MAGAIGNALPEGARGRRFLQHLALDGPARYLDASTLFRTEQMRKLFQDQAFEQVSRHNPLADSLASSTRIQPTGSARFSIATCKATCRSTSSPRSIG